MPLEESFRIWVYACPVPSDPKGERSPQREIVSNQYAFANQNSGEQRIVLKAWPEYYEQHNVIDQLSYVTQARNTWKSISETWGQPAKALDAFGPVDQEQLGHDLIWIVNPLE